MYSGYLNKRNTPISPPPMQKVFSVLWGTLLLDFDNEDDSKNNLTPRISSEVLGISEWDGQCRGQVYPHGFLLVTHTGATYYLSAPTAKEREEWILHVKQALECHFANPEVLPFKPSKMIQTRPALQQKKYCAKTRGILGHGAVYCKSCGRGYCSADMVQEPSTILQLGSEEPEKVCSDCRFGQCFVLWMKMMTYMHAMTLHELTPAVVREVWRYKASFKLRRRLSARLDMAAQLLEQNNITAEEFEELRRVDHDYRRENILEESERLKLALDTLGEDMLTVISLLRNPAATETGGRMSYYQVIRKILEIADREPELLDFYWPQLIHVHLTESANRSMSSMVKVDLLQQALLVMSQRYPILGMRLAWGLLAYVNDYSDKKVSQLQLGAAVCLLMQLELAMTGIVSAIADIPNSPILTNIVRAAPHQQQELGSELSTLFLVRRRLQEVYDAEEAARKQRISPRGASSRSARNSFGEAKPSQKQKQGSERPLRDPGASATDAIDATINGFQTTPATKSPARSRLAPISPDMEIPLEGEPPVATCLTLLNHLGVGQAPEIPAPLPDTQSVAASEKTADDAGDSGHRDNSSSSPSRNAEHVQKDAETEMVSKLADSPGDHGDTWRDSGKQNNPGNLPGNLPGADGGVDTEAETETEGDNEEDRGQENDSSSPLPPDSTPPRVTSGEKNDDSPSSEKSPVHQPSWLRHEGYASVGFIEQLDFMKQLTDLVESLRFVDRPLRQERLRNALHKMNAQAERDIRISNIHANPMSVQSLASSASFSDVASISGKSHGSIQSPRVSGLGLGWDPTTIAGEPTYRIMRIVVEECRVFRTKARAPSLIVCEVLREDVASQGVFPWVEEKKNGTTKDDHPEHPGSPVSPLSPVGKSRRRGSRTIVDGLRNRTLSGSGDVETETQLHNNGSNSVGGGGGTGAAAKGFPVVVGEGKTPVKRFETPSSPLAARSKDSDTGIEQVDSLVNSSISQAIADLQRSRAVGAADHSNDEAALKSYRAFADSMGAANIPPNTPTNASATTPSNLDGGAGPSSIGRERVVRVGSDRGIESTPDTLPPTPSSSGGGGGGRPLSGSFSQLQISRRNNNSSLLSANRKSANFKTILSSASTHDFSLVSDENELRRGADVFELDRTIRHAKHVKERDSKLRSTYDSTFSLSGPASGKSDLVSISESTSSCGASASDLQSLDPSAHSHPTANGHLPAVSDHAPRTPPKTAPAGDDAGHRRTRSATSPATLGAAATASVSSSSVHSHASTALPAFSSSLIEKSPTRATSSAHGAAALSRSPNRPGSLTSPRDDLDLATAEIVTKKVLNRARELFVEGKIDEEEYKMLLVSDTEKFRLREEVWAREEAEAAMMRVEVSFGEPWLAKKVRILGDRFEDDCYEELVEMKSTQASTKGLGSRDNSNQSLASLAEAVERGLDLSDADNNLGENGYWPVWDLRCFIVKSNDDLRQEVCCMQLMRLCREIFNDYGLGHQLWLKPYRIVSTGSNTGVVQVLMDAMSIDALKKTPGFTNLPNYFLKTYGTSPERLYAAKRNFSASLAAYSLFCYILQIKDRHNGNVLIDIEGHVIHIDFGFMLSIAPGGAFSIETAPFKLTEEMVEVLGGLESELFNEFVKAFTAGFLALRANAENLISNLTALAVNSPFPCFHGKDAQAILEKLRLRFRSDLSLKDAVQHCLDLIINSYGHYGSKQYDTFQYYTNGIQP